MEVEEVRAGRQRRPRFSVNQAATEDDGGDFVSMQEEPSTMDDRPL